MYTRTRGCSPATKNLFYNLEHAERNNAVCYFASIGICNSAAVEAGDEKAMGIPVKGNGFYVDFDGLKVMTTVERVGVANGNGLWGAGASGNGDSSKNGLLKKIGDAIRKR